MPEHVIKRDGQFEPYDKKKLEGSIKKAMIDAKLSVEDLIEEIKNISGAVEESFGSKKEVDVSEIRTNILSELESKKQAAAIAWREFDGKYKSN